jgi:phenylalanyl-tRNA synthetase beta chain
MLDVVARNLSFGSSNLRLFELGHVFSIDHSSKPKLVADYLEEERVCVLTTGVAGLRHWSTPAQPLDFFGAKGEMESLMTKIALDKWRFISYSTSNGLTGNTLTIEIHGSYAGYLGQINEEILKRFGIEQQVFVAELLVSSLGGVRTRKYEPLPRYPKVRRDVSFFVDDAVSVGRLEQVISEATGELLQAVELFDLYQGEGVEKGRKSVAFSLELMSREKTLTESEIEAAVQRVAEKVESTFGATLRRVK